MVSLRNKLTQTIRTLRRIAMNEYFCQSFIMSCLVHAKSFEEARLLSIDQGIPPDYMMNRNTGEEWRDEDKDWLYSDASVPHGKR